MSGRHRKAFNNLQSCLTELNSPNSTKLTNLIQNRKNKTYLSPIQNTLIPISTELLVSRCKKLQQNPTNDISMETQRPEPEGKVYYQYSSDACN